MSIEDIDDSAHNNENQFLTLNFIKSVKDFDDNLEDSKLLAIIADANYTMTDLLTPVIDLIDTSNTKFFDKAQSVTLMYFDYLYTRKILKLYTEAHEMEVEFTKRAKTFLDAIKAQPSKAERSQVISVGISAESRLTKNVNKTTDEFGNLLDEFGTDNRRI